MVVGSELGIAEMLIEKHGVHLRFVPEWGKWLCWDGKRWAIDLTGQVRRWTQQIIKDEHEKASRVLEKTMSQLVLSSEDSEKGKAAKKKVKAAEKVVAWWKSKASRNGVLAVETLAKTYEGVPVNYDELDLHNNLFNCDNGTINLETGVLQGHAPSDLITKLSPATYDPTAKSNSWTKFLEDIMGGDPQMVNFLQRMFGYSMSGETLEQSYFFLHGHGSNGKSTCISTILATMGDYGQTASPDLFVNKKGESHPTGVARLCGARFVASTEIEGDDKRLAEQLLKQITGGERMVARRMREDFWEFTPVLKLFLSANNIPQIEGDDHGTWRRIIPVPFNEQFEGARQDKELPNRLLNDLTGVLNWLVQGCLMWRAEGLNPPEPCQSYKNKIRSESSVIRAFLVDMMNPQERLDEDGNSYMEPPKLKKHSKKHIVAKELFAEFEKWAEDNERKACGYRKFSSSMDKQGYEKEKKYFKKEDGGNSQKQCFKGIAEFKTDNDNEPVQGELLQ